MIGGAAAVDVELTGKAVPREKLDFIYRLKTGALLEASMMIGAVLAGATVEEIKEVETMASRGRSRVPDSGRYPRCDEHSGRAWKAGSER